jgi:hypothetical protein
LSHIDIRTSERIRRYEHDHPGSLIHVDIKKLGNIPLGGGWRFVRRAQGAKNRLAAPGIRRSRRGDELVGHALSILWSTITPGWPTPRSTTMKPPTPPSRYCAEQ